VAAYRDLARRLLLVSHHEHVRDLAQLGVPDLAAHGLGAVVDLHAQAAVPELRREADGWLLVDCASMNGTWVNGTRVAGSCALRHDDVIRIPGAELRVALAGARRDEAADPHEGREADRRAEKAAYLKEKLSEQVAEDESAD
jgi:hypothetical protein